MSKFISTSRDQCTLIGSRDEYSTLMCSRLLLWGASPQTVLFSNVVATISFSQLEYTVIENDEFVMVEIVRSGDVFREAVVLIGTNPYKGSAMGK